jgi:hypothetical protein
MSMSANSTQRRKNKPMTITDWLRSHRLKAGYPTYVMMADKARALGHNTSAQALNKAERIPQYLTPATRALYVEVLKLSPSDADVLDVLAARCQIRKGSNTNPHMTVIDTRVYEAVVEESCDMVLALVSDIIARKSSVSSVEEALLKQTLKGALCRPLNQLTTESS